MKYFSSSGENFAGDASCSISEALLEEEEDAEDFGEEDSNDLKDFLIALDNFSYDIGDCDETGDGMSEDFSVDF